MMWQGYDVNDMPDMGDAINFQTKVVRDVKMDTYKKFCVEQQGNNESPCKYLFGDDIFTKKGQRDIIKKIETSQVPQNQLISSQMSL